jgi:hypothetical protein
MSLVRPCRRAVRKPVAASKEFGEATQQPMSMLGVHTPDVEQ